MKLMNRIRNAINAFRETADLNEDKLLEWFGIKDKNKKKIAETTYYTCLKMLSETMGKLPVKYYQRTPGQGKIRAEPNQAYYLASVRPNKFMTPSTFWSSVELNTEHYGNGYVWMRKRFVPSGKYGGEYQHIDWWVIPSQYVTVLMDDAGVLGDKGNLYYKYTDKYSGETLYLEQDEVMHFKTWLSFDGIMGQPVQKILETTLDGALESQNFMNKLYEQGLTASMALQYTGDLDETKVKKLQAKFEKKLSGSNNAGRIVPVPIGLTLTPLKRSLHDAQFFELKKYTALQIAAAFGIKPHQINNYEKSSYANSETQQLAFLVDTMLYRLKNYEEELNYKALSKQEIDDGKYLKFNEKAILRTDSKTQMQNLKSGVDCGIYTVNEARDYMDMPFVEGGDVPVVNGTYIPLTMAGNQYGKGSE